VSRVSTSLCLSLLVRVWLARVDALSITFCGRVMGITLVEHAYKNKLSPVSETDGILSVMCGCRLWILLREGDELATLCFSFCLILLHDMLLRPK
jgi:hypothetical protein